MDDLTDQQLLRDYAERQSEAAFAAIVQRYIDLVYSAAFRMICDAQVAKDVTQSVFVALAQNARQLTDRTALAGWLHCTARNLAAKAVRSEVRRRDREQEAAIMHELLSASPDVNWEHIAPHLDDALGELREPDRDAVLLRYFKNHDLRTVGATLGISDDAAQKRVSRAVERLREFFAKRGVTVGAGGLVVVISANAVQAAPVGLALTISAAALTGTTLATTATVTATKAIAMTTLQKTIITATIAVLAGAGIYEARQTSQLNKQVHALQQERAQLAEQLEQLGTEQKNTLQQLVAAHDVNEQFNRDREELLKLRADAANLKQQQFAAGDNTPPSNNPYGLKPEEKPPVISSSISKTAKTYGYFITQSEKGELSKAQAFHLSKAWPYLEKRFHDPEGFAQFQSEYLAAVYDIKDKDAMWMIRRALEDARNIEYAKGLMGARIATDEQRNRVPENYKEQWAAINLQWSTLNEGITAKFLELIPENQRSSLQAGNWKLLDFDPRLKVAAQTYPNTAESKDFTQDELLQAFQPPGEKAAFRVIGTNRQQ